MQRSYTGDQFKQAQLEQNLELQHWHTQNFAKNDKLNQTYIGWADTGTDAVNETQVQTVSANESGQRIMGNEVFNGVLEVWDGVPSREAQGQ